MQPKMIDDWATQHKTVVLLNGGNQQSLQDLHAFLDDKANPYPYGQFKEDNQSLNECLTCVGIILPEKIYEGAIHLRDRRTKVQSVGLGINIIISFNGKQANDHDYTDWEIELMTRMNEYRLA